MRISSLGEMPPVLLQVVPRDPLRLPDDLDAKYSGYFCHRSRAEKEGIEDIMEKIDLSVVFEYQHVFEHVGRLPEFKRMYIERREVLVCAWSER